ncbi:MAG: DUF86 domain-containing protein [Spirochaeta sp.]|jgi:uncharacterized protein YutE (UPF0331/DUF86 family)|nr:DUF86 domain-containing protein [Spirochaeta sp.]
MSENIVPDDVVVAKVASIQRCVARAREEITASGDAFATDHTRQDAAILNVTRGCEQTIDLANHLIRMNKWGVPTASADGFRVLVREGVIDGAMAERLRRMVGFRNTAVHQYEDLNMDIVRHVIEDGLDDLLSFSRTVVRYLSGGDTGEDSRQDGAAH